MTSTVEITAPVPLQRRLGSAHYKPFTSYPFSQTYLDLNNDDDETILPYMMRVQSPVRVSFTPSPFPVKRKSRVADTTKGAIFNYRPVRRGHNPSLLKFRAPDATSTSLQYLSPWISVTKTDYRDPRLTESDIIDASLGFPALYRRSLTDTSIALSRRNTPAVLRAVSQGLSKPVSRERLGTSESKDSSLSSSVQTLKRVQILDRTGTETLHASIPSDVLKKADGTLKVSTPSVVLEKNEEPPNKSPTQSKYKLTGIKEPENGLNYYNGYLPPEYSNAIAQSLGEQWRPSDDVLQDGQQNGPDEFYKPLVGDRSLYMHRAYPIQPKVLQSEIDQLRLEGRKRFLQSVGQAPVHFSAFQNHGTRGKPTPRAVLLDEAVRVKNLRQFNAAKLSRKPTNITSVDTFQQQRERTYHLQNLAREMINNDTNENIDMNIDA